MRSISTELKVGLLILAGLTIIVYSSVIVTGWRPGQGETHAYFVYFDSVAGLLVGAPVQSAGVKIGQVQLIELAGNRARVKLAIFQRYTVHSDGRAAIRSLGILGDKYVDLMLGSETSPALVDGDTVVNVLTGGDLDSLVQNLGLTVNDVRRVTSALADALGSESGKKRLDDILNQLSHATAAIAQFSEDLRGILHENRESLASTFSNLGGSMKKLNSTMDDVRSITGKIDRGEGSIGKLINDDTTVDQLNGALTGLNRYLTDLQRIKLDIGVHTEYLANQGAYKSYLGIYLQPLKDRYYLIQLIDNPRGTVHKKTTTTTTGGVVWTTQEIETTDQLQLSLLVAQRYYDTVLRGGVVENGFGFGVDQYWGHGDQYRIGLDVWDFGNAYGPHLKLAAYWRFYSNAFMVVGGDDLLSNNEKLRDAFFGIGLRFNEDSLKPLMSSLPLPSTK
jgi:phospholipid/cholesterol/gamma-HCH transport system substrate-binding protein